MTGPGQDLRYTLRGLGRARGVALTTILTLALAIGGSTAIFTAVDAVLLQPLGFPEADRLASTSKAVPRRPVRNGRVRGSMLSEETIPPLGSIHWKRFVVNNRSPTVRLTAFAKATAGQAPSGARDNQDFQ